MTIQSYDITGSNMPNINPDDRPSDINKSLVAGSIPLSKTYRENDLHGFIALDNDRNHLRVSQITYTTNVMSLFRNDTNVIRTTAEGLAAATQGVLIATGQYTNNRTINDNYDVNLTNRIYSWSSYRMMPNPS